MTEIILIKYKLPVVENECIRSILDYTNSSYHLTVYDNSEKNINLGRLWNSLIRKSEASTICLLNTDTLVEQDWLTKLESELKQNVGAVGPVTNHARNSQQREKGTGIFVMPTAEMLSGFCLLFPKQVWEEVGGFPEDYGFYGQESSFLKKVQEMGYDQVCRRDVFVFHHGSASAKHAEELGEMNMEEERKKGKQRYELDIS